jgi:hypothetical protein
MSRIFGVMGWARARGLLPRTFADLNSDYACGLCTSLTQANLLPFFCSTKGPTCTALCEVWGQGKWRWITEAVYIDMLLIFHDAHDASSSVVFITLFWFQICIKGFFVSRFLCFFKNSVFYECRRIMTADSWSLYSGVVMVTFKVLPRTLSGYSFENLKEARIIAWNCGSNSVPPEYQLAILISNPNSNL